MTPRATIVLMSHRPALLPQAVASVLRQTMPVQMIVNYAAHLWPGKFNEPASIAQGDWLIPLCDDDALHPRFVERCLFFSGNADLVFTDRAVFWTRWDWRNPSSWVHRTPWTAKPTTIFPAIAKLAAEGNGAASVILNPHSFAFGAPYPMTCLIRRSLWESLGGYDQINHADTDFYYRAVKAGAKLVYVPEPLFVYRFHAGNISMERPSNGRAALDFHRKHFLDFGFAFTPHPTLPDEMECTIIPEAERADYARRHGMKVVA